MQIRSLQMKRALRSVLLVLLLSAAGMGKMDAQEFTEGNLRYSINDDGISVTVKGLAQGVSASGSLVIPNAVAYNGISYPVTVIANYAFQNKSGFTGSLTIGNSVTTIGNYAFEYCDGFSGSLTIPNSVTSIGSDAFFWCSGFTGNLIIPNSVTTIGGYAFRGCSGFTEVHYNATNCADANSSYPPFRDCRGTLVIGNNVERIPKNMFSYGGFIGGLTIPNSVTSIGGSAFYNCSGIYFITSLAETPPTLGYEPFGAWNTTIPVYVPCGMEEVYSSLFWGGFSNFYGMCEGGVVTVIAIPEEGGIVTGGGSFEAGETCTVTAIANEGYAFANWTLNGLIVSMNTEYTFYVAGDMNLVANFASLDNIVFADANVKSICVSHWDTNGDGELSYAEAASVTSLNNYFQSNAQITSFEELQYFSGLTSIGDQAFRNCSGLVSIVLPGSVTSIGNYAFCNCSAFTGDLIIPNSVNIIGGDAFNGCSGFMGSLTIGNSVTTIGDNAFCGCSGFTGSLTIPNTVTTIGGAAFSGCTGFTGDLVIPNSLTTINNYTFQNCSGFTGSLTIPNSVTSIGAYAFSGCNGFTGDLVIPNSVTTINNYAFQNCSGFTGSLTIPNSVTYIGSAFSGCSFAGLDINMSNIRNNFVSNIGGSYSGSLTIGNSVTSIGNSAFQNCNSFTEVHYNASNCANVSNTSLPFSGCGGTLVIGDNVERIPNNMFCGANFVGNLTIPNSVTTIGQNAFSNCPNFTGSLTIGNSVTSIGNNAFSGCSFYGLEVDMTNIPNSFVGNIGGSYSGSLTIGNSVTTIGNYAFSYCSGFIGNLTIGNSVTTIGDYAFRNCSGFTGSLTIGNSVTSIGNNALQGCTGFTEVHYNATNCADVSQNAQYFSSCNGSLSIGDNVERIPAYMFYGAGFTGSLTIPNSVTTIGSYAFSYCNGFTGDLVIPNSVTTIGGSAFSGCSGFTGNLIIGNFVTTIGNMAFGGCTGLTGSLIIGNSVTTIDSYAFNGCSGLSLITIPNSVTSIGSFAFSNCSGLETIMVESGNLVYDSRENCNAIIMTSTNELISGCKNTVIPNTVTSIGYSAFNGHCGLISITIPNSVTSIGSNSFSFCSGLTTITIPNSVTSIGIDAFSNCSSLETTIVEAGNPEFDSRENCNAIINTTSNTLIVGCKNTVIPNSVTSIGNRAFLGCSGLTGNLSIPNSVITIGDYAFYGCSGLTGSLIIPDAVTSIGNYSFCSCEGFTGSLTIPNSVTSIGTYAFFYCSGFTEAMMFGAISPSLGGMGFYGTNFPIYVPYESLNAYKIATNWSNYEDRIFPMAYTTIPGYGESEGNYRFVASPLVENTAPTTVDNMITETAYDLYRFNQAEDAEWQNYKTQTDSFVLENGQGYLYANSEEVNVIFKGEFNEDETKEIGLAYDANAEFAGWNLVGNPFPVSAYTNRSYYTMNGDGTAVEPNALSSGSAIPACTGIMVMAEAEGETVVFSTEAPDTVPDKGCLQIALSQVVEPVETPTRKQDGPSTLRQAQGSGTLLDKAIVSFNANDRLEKFVFNMDNARISIPQSGKELAIACSDKRGEMPLNFKATKNGQYIISVSYDDVEMDYLHLIDNLTGNDIDLLATSNYTFEAKTTDYASRFRLVFSANETDGPSTGSGTFAFINNGNIIIKDAEAGAMLQIVDMQGRIIVNTDVARNVSTSGMTSGLYVLRLVNGDDVKTQKIMIE